MASMAASVVRLPDGAIALRLATRERAIVRALVADLRAIVGEETTPPGVTDATDEDRSPDEDAAADEEATGTAVETDPVLVRLYPDARPDDAAWSARFRDLVRGGLDDARRANIGVVE